MDISSSGSTNQWTLIFLPIEMIDACIYFYIDARDMYFHVNYHRSTDVNCLGNGYAAENCESPL
jgi:hypothetical protein